MTDDRARAGAARDVPPPRPVRPSGPEVGPDDGPVAGLSRAARALADAVAGLLDARDGDRERDPTGTSRDGGSRGRRAAAAGLRDVVAAVAGALGTARSGGTARPQRDTAGAPDAAAEPAAGAGRSPGALLGDLLTAAAPRLPIRDRDRLRSAYPDRTDDEIADALVARAARLTTGVGAATGGLAAAQWFAPPSLLALPLELGAETVLVAAVETVLVGELHELYGRRPEGDARDRAGAYLASWSARRAVGAPGTGGMVSVLGAAGLQALRRSLGRRLARAVPSAAPFMIGAALAGRGNRKATEALAARLIADLRGPRSSVRGDPADG